MIEILNKMKEIELLVLQKLLMTLRLQKAKAEFGNKYVFGFDDVLIVLGREISELQK